MDKHGQIRSGMVPEVRIILKIIVAYLIFGTLWVSTSDLLLYARREESVRDALLGLGKGLLFVAVSALLMYGLISRVVCKVIIERASLRERLRTWNLDANDIVMLLDGGGAIVEANDRAVNAYGYTAELLTSKNIADLLADKGGFEERWATLLRDGTLCSEAVHRRANGSEFPIECSARRCELDGSLYIHCVIRDISSRQSTERQLIRLKDAYAALSQTNQCINQSPDRDTLFRQTCDIAASYSNVQLAWIGTIDASSGTVTPVAHAGPAAEYLYDLRVSVEPNSHWGAGIVGRAIRSRAPVVINELWNSDGFQPWTERLRSHGIQSWAAFPLFEDGQPASVLALYSSDPLAFDDGSAEVLREMAEDLSLALDRLALRSKHRRLEQELKILKQAVEQSPVAIVMSDSTGAIEYVNPAFSATSGYAPQEVLGKNPRFLKSGETSPDAYREMWQKLLSGEAWSGEFHNRRKDGTLYWEEAVISPVKDADGVITHYIAVKQDVTARREVEEKAQFLAFHDPLTELPNRLVAKSDANEAIARAKRNGGKVALLFIDVDNFKRVNDSLGHAIGDELLRALAKRLSSCMRDGDAFSRVSGDEFLVIAKGLQDARSVERIAERIRKEASTPLNVSGIDVSTTLSIGAALYPDDGQTFDDLHRQADLAMYCAKREGRNTFRAYSRMMDSDAHDYLLTVNGIRKALERGEFVLYYQPQVHLDTREVQGVEALIRWNHPELGLVGPNRFIPVAEESGLIIEIGNWVIGEVCRQAAEWSRHGVNGFRISANVSALQLRRDLDRVIADALRQWRVEPNRLEIELTESSLVQNSSEVSDVLKRLKNLDVGIALDDFGTGYSNFTYLKHFDLDRLKIDQSFVRHITSNKGDAAIVKSIVQLARNFGLETIAEGVETPEALKVVRRAGCGVVQGYLFARPMPAGDVPAFLAQQMSMMCETEIDMNKCQYFPPKTIQ